MGAAAPRELRLYIDSTSLPLVQQMADFVVGAHDGAVSKIMTWLRLPLAAGTLAPFKAQYIKQLAGISPEFVARVATFVQQQGFERIRIHSNQFHAWRGVAPLLRALLPLLRTRDVELSLDLYDDGTVGLLHREQLKALPDPDRALREAAAHLRAHLHEGQPLQWSVAAGYAWQHLFPTRYHMLRPDLLLRDERGRALHALLAAQAVPMRFDGLRELSDAQQRLYLQLFGLDEAWQQRLAPLAGSDRALLFTASSAWDKAQNLLLRNSQVQAIAQLREGGCIPADWRICFKGHPANGDHDATLMSALGDEVVALPARVPLEVLLMAGLLPLRVAGVLSSSFCTLPAQRIEYMLCRRSAAEGGAGAPLLQLMLETGMVAPERVLPMLD